MKKTLWDWGLPTESGEGRGGGRGLSHGQPQLKLPRRGPPPIGVLKSEIAICSGMAWDVADSSVASILGSFKFRADTKGVSGSNIQ